MRIQALRLPGWQSKVEIKFLSRNTPRRNESLSSAAVSNLSPFPDKAENVDRA